MFSRIKGWIKEFKDLKYFAYHDALTGLYNRHYLNTLDSSKYRYVYFIDINNLKEYNKDGHTSGDKRIMKCLNFVQDWFIDKNDCFIRYGGDEFILLSPHQKTITSNGLYTVGEARIFGSLEFSLNLADKIMLANKNKSKCYNEKYGAKKETL